jgi:hypothetical protein
MTFEEWLVEELENAERDARGSRKVNPNSYGAGDDAGYVKALQAVMDRMTPQIARCSLVEE